MLELLRKPMKDTNKPPVKEQENTKNPASFGDKCFDTCTYGLIGGVATFLASLKFGFSARYGKLAPTLERWTQSMEKTGLSRANAENLVMTTALMMGGNVMLPVIRAAEHYRTPIVNAFNSHKGQQPVTEDSQAKQSWGSILKGRALAWVMVFSAFKGTAALIGPDKFEKFEHDFARNLVCKPLGKPTHIHGMETKLYRYGRIGALDIFATTAATILLYFSSRFFAAQSANPPQAASAMAATKTEEQNGLQETPNVYAARIAQTPRRETLKPLASYASLAEFPRVGAAMVGV